MASLALCWLWDGQSFLEQPQEWGSCTPPLHRAVYTMPCSPRYTTMLKLAWRHVCLFSILKTGGNSNIWGVYNSCCWRSKAFWFNYSTRHCSIHKVSIFVPLPWHVHTSSAESFLRKSFSPCQRWKYQNHRGKSKSVDSELVCSLNDLFKRESNKQPGTSFLKILSGYQVFRSSESRAGWILWGIFNQGFKWIDFM